MVVVVPASVVELVVDDEPLLLDDDELDALGAAVATGTDEPLENCGSGSPSSSEPLASHATAKLASAAATKSAGARIEDEAERFTLRK